MQSKEQLIKLMGYYADKGDLAQARKINIKIMAIDDARLKELSTIDIDNINYSDIMTELNEMQFLTSSE